MFEGQMNTHVTFCIMKLTKYQKLNKSVTGTCFMPCCKRISWSSSGNWPFGVATWQAIGNPKKCPCVRCAMWALHGVFSSHVTTPKDHEMRSQHHELQKVSFSYRLILDMIQFLIQLNDWEHASKVDKEPCKRGLQARFGQWITI